MSKVPISEGKRLCEKYKAPVVIVFTILDGGDTFNVMTYGATKALCRHAASLGEQISTRILNGTISPEQVDPAHLPNQPTNWRGERPQP